MRDKDDLLTEIKDTVDVLQEPAGTPEENVELRVEETPVSDEPGSIEMRDESGKDVFEGIIDDKDVEFTGPESAAGIIEKVQEKVIEQLEAVIKIEEGEESSPDSRG